jgi:hypothetical protein
VSPTDAAREPVSTPHTTRQFTRPDVASIPNPAATTAPQSQAVTPATGGSDTSGNSGNGDSAGTTAEEQQTTPAPSATDSSDSGTSTSPTSPAPEETSPAQLCVLNLVCLG